jgi:hypothetical protein
MKWLAVALLALLAAGSLDQPLLALLFAGVGIVLIFRCHHDSWS